MGFGSWIRNAAKKIGGGIKKAAVWSWDKVKKGAHVVKKLISNEQVRPILDQGKAALAQSGDPRAMAAAAAIGGLEGLVSGDTDKALGAAASIAKSHGGKYSKYAEYIPTSKSDVGRVKGLVKEKARKRATDWLENAIGSKRTNHSTQRNAMSDPDVMRHHPQYSTRVTETSQMQVPMTKKNGNMRKPILNQ